MQMMKRDIVDINRGLFVKNLLEHLISPPGAVLLYPVRVHAPKESPKEAEAEKRQNHQKSRITKRSNKKESIKKDMIKYFFLVPCITIII